MVATTQVRIGGAVIDPGRVARPLEIKHGRSGVAAQPDAPECTFTWADPNFPAWQPGALVEVVVHVGPGPTWDDLPRFVGELAAVTAVEQLGRVVAWQVRAVGRLAALGRVPVVLDRPAENDFYRINAIAAAAGITGFSAGSPGITLAAGTIDTDALSALHDVCQSSGGLVWQDRTGALWYGAADHRSAAPIAGTLPASVIVDGIQWAAAAESIVNHVTVSWGPEDARGQATHSDPGSITAYGIRHADANTQCASEADADELALLIIARRKAPYWVLSDVLVPLDILSPVGLDGMMQVDISTAALLPITATPQPTPGPLTGWTLEGWVERWDESGHWMQLALSDRARWVETTFRTWATAATATWADEAAGSWLDALIEEAA